MFQNCFVWTRAGGVVRVEPAPERVRPGRPAAQRVERGPRRLLRRSRPLPRGDARARGHRRQRGRLAARALALARAHPSRLLIALVL